MASDPGNLTYRWRADVSDDELVRLTESHGGTSEPGWWERIRRHSLGWVSARPADGALVGFVNLAWDGGAHAFLLDTKVRPDLQRRGIATELVRCATVAAREAGCEWLHVDHEPHRGAPIVRAMPTREAPQPTRTAHHGMRPTSVLGGHSAVRPHRHRFGGVDLHRPGGHPRGLHAFAPRKW